MNKSFFKSLGFRTFIYIVIFAVVLLALIWFLQSYFLNTQYEQMKIDVVKELTTNIEHKLENGRGLRDINRVIKDYSSLEDCNVVIETDSESLYFSPHEKRFSDEKAFPYNSQLNQIKEKLLASGEDSASLITMDSTTNTKTLSYGKIAHTMFDGPVSLYVFSPLYPVESTVSIIRTQMIYITIIALVASFLIAFFISRKFSKPIKDITETASNLGTGNYNITFNKGGYVEIDNLSKTLNTVTSELKKTEEYRNDLMANVSHDLKTPLTMIQSYAEMIRDLSGNNKEKREEHLNVIIEETHRLNKLVTDMLNITRLHSGKTTLDKKEFSFNKCLDSVLDTYKILCEQDGYQIDYHPLKVDCLVYGDEAKIKQVITNFINNAAKYGGDDKYIKVSLKRKASSILFEVTDHGNGIKEDEINHVWDRYYKTSANHARNSEGTGLGLSICKEILSLHNLNFGVRSKEGSGSTFWFEMPLAPSH